MATKGGFKKRLVIDYPEDGGKPEVTFVGSFTGRDILTLGRIVAIAYRTKKNEIVRQSQSLNELAETL
jgi:hypothetical protein